MYFESREHKEAHEASVEKWELDQERAKARQFWQAVNLLVFFAILVAALYLFFESVLPDLAWCHENYALENIPHCYFYENSIWGRFVNPITGFTLPG